MASKGDVEALLDRNLTVREIAERIGADTAYVRATLIRNRWQGRAVMVGPGNGHHPKFGRLRQLNTELLEALKGVLWMAEEWYRHGGDETTMAADYGGAIERANAAIAKAEGKPCSAD